ncbi:hypothetical protein [Saxibacter everestensis]|uniref:hypothetical protein n=1 Tax=Saxibacter everestensis TaxID=2909229 RepID=UPI0032E35E32
MDGPDAGTVHSLNDQHGYLSADDLSIGSTLRFGLSHPSTAFGKWQLFPVVPMMPVSPRSCSTTHSPS